MKKAALILLSITIAFNSCNKDDNSLETDTWEKNTPTKLIKRAQGEVPDYFQDFTYDSEGRLVSIEDRNGVAVTAEYSDDMITYKEYSSRDEEFDPYIFTMFYILDSKGRVIDIVDARGESSEVNFTYKNDYLIKLLSETAEYSYSWKNGNMVERKSKSGTVRKYEYADVVNYMSYNNQMIFMEEPLMFSGMTCRNLISKISYTNSKGDWEIIYEYEYDMDGYPVEMKEIEYLNGEESWSYTTTFTYHE